MGRWIDIEGWIGCNLQPAEKMCGKDSERVFMCIHAQFDGRLRLH